MTHLKKVLTVLVGIVLVFSLFNCVPPQTQVESDEMRAAKEEAKQANLQQCKFRLSNGNQYMLQQLWSDALDNYKQVIDRGCAEEYVDPLFKYMAKCYMKLNMPDSAAFYIDKGLEYDATNQYLLQLSAYYQERAGNFEGAVAVYEKYNALYPEDVEYMTKQAQALDKIGLYEEELEIWERIMELDPENKNALNSVITVFGYLGRDPKEFYQQAWEANQTDASKALNYINALTNTNDYATALTVCQSALMYNQQNITLVRKVAECFEMNGKFEDAAKALENYAVKHPRDITIQVEVTKKYIDLEKYQKAYSIIDNAIKMAPKDKNAYYARAQVLESMAQVSMSEKSGKLDTNDKIVFHMAFEDYQTSKKLGNFNARFKVKYLYDNDLTIAKAKDRFLIGDVNKVTDNEFKPVGEFYQWITRTVKIQS